MSKQIFYYGAMNSAKSAQLLMQNYNYKDHGANTLLVKPAIDTRDGYLNISSRIGLKSEADYIIKPDTSQEEIMDRILMNGNNIDVILVDEGQFISKKQADALSESTRIIGIELHVFGLLKDFQNNLFEGSQDWLETSDNIVEIKTTCSKCTRKATCNLRLNDGEPVYDGDVVQIGGNESYVSVCREHYYNYGD